MTVIDQGVTDKRTTMNRNESPSFTTDKANTHSEWLYIYIYRELSGGDNNYGADKVNSATL